MPAAFDTLASIAASSSLASISAKAMFSRTSCADTRRSSEHHRDVALLRRHVVDAPLPDADLAVADLLQPAIMRSSVDLPQPDGPTSTVNEPSAIAMSTPCSTSTSPKRLRTLAIVTAA